MYVITLMMCVNTMCTCTVHVYVNKTSLEYSNYSVVQQYIEQKLLYMSIEHHSSETIISILM